MMLVQAEPEDLVEEMLDLSQTMIKQSWGVRSRILAEVRRESRRAEDGWARLGYETLAQRVHCEPRYCHKILRKMCQVEWVLVRGQVGVGTRGTAYRINLDPLRWRCVPWLVDRETLRLAFRPFYSALERGAKGSLAPRSASSAPRLHGAGLTPSKRSHHKIPPRDSLGAGLTHRDEPPADVSPAPCDNGANPGVDTQNDACTPSSFDLITSTAKQQQQEIEFEAQKRIVRAIETKTKSPCNGPSLLERILRMGCDENSVTRALKAIEAAPANYRPPMVVEFVERVFAGNIPLPGDPSARYSRDEGEEWAARVRRLLETTIDEQTRASLREDLARWEDDRAHTHREAM